MSAHSRQIRSITYVLDDPPDVEPDVCRHCGADIVQVGDRWYALEGRWPNLAHCFYLAADGVTSIGHLPG